MGLEGLIEALALHTEHTALVHKNPSYYLDFPKAKAYIENASYHSRHSNVISSATSTPATPIASKIKETISSLCSVSINIPAQESFN